VNVTYERYVFNRRTQDSNERFDVFLGDIRRLARSCDFAAVEESMIRDRIVVGIHDDATRHKLLQVRDLSLAKAIDICKASEAAKKQMKAMSADDQVQALNPVKRSTVRARARKMSRGRGTRDHSNSQRCKYCNRKHEQRKEACPAYGQVCRRCSRKHHFESVCQSKASGKKIARHDVHQIKADDDDDDDEELLGDGDAY